MILPYFLLFYWRPLPWKGSVTTQQFSSSTANFQKTPTAIIFPPVFGHLNPALGVSLPRLGRAYCSKQRHTTSFCCTARRLGGYAGRSNVGYLIHSAIDSIWVADREITFHLHHNFASRNFFPAKMPLLRCYQQCLLSNGDHRARGRQEAERCSVPCRHACWRRSHTWRGRANCKLLSHFPMNHFYFCSLPLKFPLLLLSNWCCNMVTLPKSVSR